MILTIFDTKNKENKFPKSFFDDNTFVFRNVCVDNNFQAYQILVNNFTLNMPLVIHSPTRMQRKKQFLSAFQHDELDYILLDIDCDNESNKNKILNYFKNTKCIIGESRSYNNFDNFNLKGILFTEKLPLKDLKVIQAQIQKDLSDFGTYNEDVLRVTYFTAPLLKSKILLNNEDGNILKKIDNSIINYIEKINNINFEIESKNVVDACLETYKKLGFNVVEKRLDNSIIFEKNGDKNYFWFADNPYIMNNINRLKSINIWNIVKHYENINFDIESILDYEGDIKTDNLIFDDAELNNLIEGFLFKKSGVLTLRSFMGSGKTNLIKTIINETFDRDLKVIIVTNRISVALDYHKKFNIKLYLKDVEQKKLARKNAERSKDGKNTLKENKDYSGESVICQYDSLWKYNPKDFDVVILDEFVSLMLHSRNNLTNRPDNFINFYTLLKKRVVIADAFLCKYIIDLIPNKNIINITNNIKDCTQLYKANDKSSFMYYLINAVRENKKISISCTSNSEITVLYNILKKYKKRIQILDANTDEITKQIVYREMMKEDTHLYDILIFSPVVTVGISYLNNIDIHFHFDNSKSVDSISSLQMLKRARKPKQIIYYVENRKVYKCLNIKTIIDNLRNDRGHPVNSHLFDSDPYNPAINEYGKLASKIDLFNNMLTIDHQSSFEKLLKINFENTPIILANQKIDINIHTDKSTRELNKDKYAIIKKMFGYEHIPDEKLDIVFSALSKRIIFDIESDIEIIKLFLNHLFMNNPNDFFKKLYYLRVFKNNFDDSSLMLINDGDDIIIRMVKNDFKFSNEFNKNISKDLKIILLACGYMLRGDKYVIHEDYIKLCDYVKSI